MRPQGLEHLAEIIAQMAALVEAVEEGTSALTELLARFSEGQTASPVVHSRDNSAFTEEATERRSDIPMMTVKPHWDAAERKLLVGSALIKHFKQPADSQEQVLNEFQNLGWPKHIMNPLSDLFHADKVSRLRDTVKALNGHHATRGVLRFYMDGRGEGAKYEIGGEQAPHRSPS